MGQLPQVARKLRDFDTRHLVGMQHGDFTTLIELIADNGDNFIQALAAATEIPAEEIAGANIAELVALAGAVYAAILQTGEEVLSRRDPRNQANGGAGQSIRIINAINPDNIHNAMSTSGGEKVIVNAVRANAGAVRQILSQT